jgi:hypothetical protein
MVAAASIPADKYEPPVRLYQRQTWRELVTLELAVRIHHDGCNSQTSPVGLAWGCSTGRATTWVLTRFRLVGVPTIAAPDTALRALEIGGHTRFQGVLWRKLFPALAARVMLIR